MHIPQQNRRQNGKRPIGQDLDCTEEEGDVAIQLQVTGAFCCAPECLDRFACLLSVKPSRQRVEEKPTDAGYAGYKDDRRNPCQAHDDVDGPVVAALGSGDAEEGYRNAAFYHCGANCVKVLCDVKDLRA